MNELTGWIQNKVLLCVLFADDTKPDRNLNLNSMEGYFRSLIF